MLKKYGIKTKIISADDEALFSVRGVVAGDKRETVLIDLGGASTEVILVRKNTIEKFKSFQIGAVNKASTFIESEAILYLKSGLTEKKIILVGGTAVSLAISMLGLSNFNSKAIDSSSFELPEIITFSKKLREMSNNEIESEFPFMAQEVKLYQRRVLNIFVGFWKR